MTDPGNRRVQIFTPAGAWVASWAPLEPGLVFQVPGAIAVNPAGRVYVADALTRTLWQFAPDVTVLGVNLGGGAEALAVDRLRRLYVLRGDRSWIDVATTAEAPGRGHASRSRSASTPPASPCASPTPSS